MEFKRLEEIPLKNPYIDVKVTEMGNIIEITYMSKCNQKQTVQMLKGGEKYVICSTGEIKPINHINNRSENQKGLLRTFKRLRALINTNVTDTRNVRWCTLTYKENMIDTKRLYKDFEKFHKRFLYYCFKNKFDTPNYISIAEPQRRNALHLHLLYIWSSKAPFIPNKDFAELWKHGFVKIGKLTDVDNVGAYLTAYLTNLEIPNIDAELVQDSNFFKKVEVDGKSKAILKGGRLSMYPPKFNIFRYSKGIKQPTSEWMSQDEAREMVQGAVKTSERAIKLIDTEHDFESIIIKEQYNRLRKK